MIVRLRRVRAFVTGTAGICLLVCAVGVNADVIRIPQDFLTIQAGMDAAQAGDTVLVADGVYTGRGNKDLFYPGVPLTLRSENGAESCIIDCEGVGGAFFLVADEPPDFIIDGFTIRNGNGSPGGAFFIHHDSRATIRNCVITQCTSNTGGAILCENSSSPTLINCVITANTATNGGGLYIWDESSPTLINCTITNNIADADGGGVYFSTFGTSPRLINCTITDNLGQRSGGGVFVAGGNPVIVDSIVWRNTGEQITDNSETLTVRYSDVEGGWPGTGNIDADPLFVDPTNGDYRLLPGSPVIDAADNTAVPEGVTTDLDGQPRFVDDPDTEDTGNGLPPIVDMGAFEFQGVTGTPAELTDLTMIDGFIVSGGLPEMAESDDTYLETEAKVTGEAAETHRLLMRIRAMTAVQNPDTINITLEAHITDIEAIVTLFLRDFDTGLFEQVGQFTNGFGADTTNTVNVPNASRFVRPNGRIVLRVKKIVILPFTLSGFHSLEDLLEIRVR